MNTNVSARYLPKGAGDQPAPRLRPQPQQGQLATPRYLPHRVTAIRLAKAALASAAPHHLTEKHLHSTSLGTRSQSTRHRLRAKPSTRAPQSGAAFPSCGKGARRRRRRRCRRRLAPTTRSTTTGGTGRRRAAGETARRDERAQRGTKFPPP